MKLHDALGMIQVSGWTIFDAHLLLLFVPIAFMAALFVLKPKNWSHKSKNIAIKSSSALLFLTVILSIVQKWFTEWTFEDGSSTLTVFTNLDIIFALFFGVTLATKRYSLTRTMIPGAIVLSLMRLINNPGASLGVSEIIVDLSLICVSLLMVPVFNKTISAKSHLFLVLVTMFAIAYIFVFNKVTSTNYSNLSLNEIVINPVYAWMPNDALVITSFLLAIIFFETLIWVVVRTWFSIVVKGNKHESFKNTFKYEWFSTKNELDRQFTKFSIAEMYLDVQMIDELNNSADSAEELDMEQHIVKNLKEENPEPADLFILPKQLVVVKTSKGIRAPSLV